MGGVGRVSGVKGTGMLVWGGSGLLMGVGEVGVGSIRWVQCVGVGRRGEDGSVSAGVVLLMVLGWIM